MKKELILKMRAIKNITKTDDTPSSWYERRPVPVYNCDCRATQKPNESGVCTIHRKAMQQ